MSNSESEIPVRKPSTFGLVVTLSRELKSKYIWIILTALLFGVLGTVYAIRSKKKYIARSSFILDSSKGSSGLLGGYMQLAGQLGVFGGKGMGLDAENVKEITKSRRIVSSALLKTCVVKGKSDLLANHLIIAYDLEKSFAKKKELINFEFAREQSGRNIFLQDSLLGYFCKMLTNQIEVNRNAISGIVEIICTTPNEEISKYLCDFLSEAISDFHLITKTEKERKNMVIIQSRLDSISDALNNATTKFARWKDSNKRMVKMEGSIEELYLKREVELLNAMAVEATKNVELAKFSLQTSTPLFLIIDHPIFPLDFQKTGKVKGAFIGMIIGFVISSGIILFRKLWKEILKSEGL